MAAIGDREFGNAPAPTEESHDLAPVSIPYHSLALPSATVGALLSLKLFNFDMAMMAIIGIIMLIGIVKKNAIMMIDFALARERGSGKSAEDLRSAFGGWR